VYPRTERNPTGHSPTDSLRVWIVVMLFFGVTDTVTTVIGHGMRGISEAGPLTALFIQQYGLGAIVVLKAVVLVGGYLLWTVSPHPGRVGVPLGLSLVGVSATGWNLYILALVGLV